MNGKQVQTYGTWSSPVTPQMLAEGVRLSDVQWATDGNTLVWCETRGRQGVLLAQRGLDAPRDLTPSSLSVRGGVGYGGGEFTLAGDQVFFAARDGRLYRQPLGAGLPRPITPQFGAAAAPTVSMDGRWVVFVHHNEGVDGLAVVDTNGEQWPRKLVFGADFYMQPTWHPGGTRLAYICWNKPQMPWDGTELRLVTLIEDGGTPAVESVQVVAGDAQTAIFQPTFSPDGRKLAYISDASGWSRIYLYDLAEGTHRQLTLDEAEYGIPAWVQGMRTYGWSHDSQSIYALRSEQGFTSLRKIELATGRNLVVEGMDDYTAMEQIAVSPRHHAIAVLVSSPRIPKRVVSLEPNVNLPVQLAPSDTPTIHVMADAPRGVIIHRRSTSENLRPEALAAAEAVTWDGVDGERVYGLYYTPTNPRFEGKGLPPLVVLVHSGPTSQARPTFSGEVQFFATRGFAVLQVNYRGSTGAGRAYMEKLRGAWGQIDVEDCASGARWLADEGRVDPHRRVIVGGSAGGYTVLQSLVRKPGFYTVGVCAYGISNQFAIASEAEFKFEAHYTESLLGPLPDRAPVYRERSPVFHADKIVDPVIIFQGAEDKVVPPAQSESIVAVLRRRGVPHEYHVFPGEGHGFRQPETIEAYYTLMMRFIRQYVLYA